MTEQAREELEQAVAGLAGICRDGIPGCADASVTVLHGGEARTMSATAPRAVRVDEQQYEGGDGPCLSAMSRRDRVSVPDFGDEGRWPQVTSEGRRLGIHSSLSLPLEGDGQVLGALNLYGEAVGAFGQDSHRAADAFAQQAVVILRFLNQLDVERAEHAQERAVAAELQRSLLPTLPHIDGIDAAARYLVSGSAVQVGGDWYDLFALPDGAIGVAVGDVMGHDVTAAASMGQLRSVLRSYAYEGSSPAIVLDRMDRLVQGFEMAALATAIYGRLFIDRGEGLFLFCNAGHLPPLVRNVDGSVQRLERGAHHLIGALPPWESFRGEAAVTLPAGSVLLLYTDGLVETHTRSFDDGIDQLAAVLAAQATGQTPEQICDALVAAMVGEDPEDDVALLVIRIGRGDQQDDPGVARTRRPEG